MNLKELDSTLNNLKRDYQETGREYDKELIVFYTKKRKELISKIKQTVNEKLTVLGKRTLVLHSSKVTQNTITLTRHDGKQKRLPWSMIESCSIGKDNKGTVTFTKEGLNTFLRN